MLVNCAKLFAVQKYCMHCKPGMQTGSKEDCSTCPKCWIQPQTICCSNYANPWPSYNGSNLQLGQDGLHWCKKVHNSLHQPTVLSSTVCEYQ